MFFAAFIFLDLSSQQPQAFLLALLPQGSMTSDLIDCGIEKW